MKRVVVMSALCLLVVSLSSCGKKDGAAPGEPAAAVPAAQAPAQANAGEVLAKEVIAAFDEIVAEVAKALEGKPDEATALPKLQAIRDAWKPKMEAFAARRKALTDPPVLGAFHSYMGQERGKAMFRKDQVLGTVIGHYRNMSPAPGIVSFLSTDLIELMEIAHNK